MDESAAVAADPARHTKKGRPLLAWCVIVLAVGLIVWAPARENRAAPEGPSRGAQVPAVFSLQARYLIGAATWTPRGKQAEPFKEQVYQSAAAMLDAGSFWQRLGFAVLAGELAGPREALDRLARLTQRTERQEQAPSPEQAHTQSLLEAVYRDYERDDWAAKSLTSDERGELVRRLGWLGQLALAPAAGPDAAARQAVLRSAQRLVMVLLGFLALLVLAGGAGLLGLILFLFLISDGSIKSALLTGTGHGSIYAETFALWLVVFGGLSIATSLLPAWLPRLAMLSSVMFVSLAALAWPVARGIAWREVRRDIGWTPGRAPLVEPFLGGASYVMGLPLLAVGLGLTLFLIFLQNSFAPVGQPGFGPAPMPSHPIVEMLAQAGLWGRLQIFLLAAVAAPIVEETMFRGVLYRHLRDASARWGTAASVIASGTLTSFVFAVIHPQGLATVPALMALAYTFTAAREWRGTLIPSMVAHGVQNGLLMAVLMFVL